jgi:hypothetical protein
MPRIEIDEGRMFCAIADTSDPGYSDKGYLNLKTGEIVFILDAGAIEAEGTWGKDPAVDMVFDQAVIDAAPHDWIEIPKYDPRFEKIGEKEFIGNFLAEQGIDVERWF